MPQKRTSSEPNNGTPKQVRIEHPEEFSKAVKKRLQSSTRTGQACDRCKIRKIRCDGLPGGCSPCLQNNTECRTTDRITGRATSRGYVEGLEQQNRDLQLRIRELEQRLMQNGVDIKPSNGFHANNVNSYDYGNASEAQTNGWGLSGTPYPTSQGTNSLITQQHQETNMFRALPTFRAGCTGDNYLGVSPGNSHLSSIKGTALSILGMEIDIADFASEDMDEPHNQTFHHQLYNKSYQAFLQSALNINPKIEKIDLPPRADGFTYAQWYFRVLNPFLPILHKPSFFKLLTRVYDEPSFRPTTAETVMVHMVFAIMFFQYAVRNWEDATQHAHLNQQSNLHYHYALSLFYQLSCSHTAQDVQALTLICSHLRNFPKPGASWILTQNTISLAIELGLHRSVKRWAPEFTPNLLDIEIRKRTFWSILGIHVTLSGKLGRPMVLRLEDFDVELPEAIDDDQLSENGLETPPSGRCYHKIGLQVFKMLPLYMEMYSTIYAVRRHPETYIATVSSLEGKLRDWKEGIPPELVKGEAGQDSQEGRVFALYAQAWALEFRLLLRHPSVSMTTDASFNAESMRICVESARQMLSIVRQIQKLKSLDTTWYNSAVYVMAITTTLFGQWEKRDETTAADLAALREEMDLWLDIIGDIGAYLGSGTRLREAVKVVTDGTLGLLSKSLPNKSPGFLTGNHALEDTKPQVAQTPQTPYPAATQYSAYPDSNSNSSALTYSSQENHGFTNYPANDSVEAPLLAAFAAQASQVAPNNWQRPHNPASHAWQQWTSTMAGNLEPQDCYSANALMQLGGRDLGNTENSGQTTAPITDMAVTQVSQPNVMPDQSHMAASNSSTMGAAWPLNIFDIGHSGAAAS
ncbi:hypothetical protein B7463_g3610, partial [Scytalidium lignicola]